MLLNIFFYDKIIIGDCMKKDNNIDTEFADIDKENKYKDYIIVGILYIVVIILSYIPIPTCVHWARHRHPLFGSGNRVSTYASC